MFLMMELFISLPKQTRCSFGEFCAFDYEESVVLLEFLKEYGLYLIMLHDFQELFKLLLKFNFDVLIIYKYIY